MVVLVAVCPLRVTLSAGSIRLDLVADWTPLRSALADVETSATFTWAELDAFVGGLPRSAYVHNAFWKGARSGWPGFTTNDVRVGESVTFVRVGSTVPPRPAPSANATARAGAAKVDAILVGCVKKKLPVAAPAKELYVSALFRKERAYAERAEVPWFILSAQHGLVAPEDVLEPYDLRLSSTSREYRREWSRQVVDQLGDAVGALEGRIIEIHAGAAYADVIRAPLATAGADVVEPLSGLKLGPRLAWYGQDSNPTVAASLPPRDIGDIRVLIDELTAHDSAIAPKEFLEIGAGRFRSPGLYSWWVDRDGASDLAMGLGHPVEEGLIYAGLAGATRSGGRKSKNTLWGRIKTMHLGGRHEFSTFRLSLGSVLAASADAAEIDEAALTAWMHKHLRLVAVPVADAETLGGVETDVLAQLNPPLNLDKVPRDPRRQRLTELRKRYGRK